MAPGRPRLSPADYEERLASYCRRYGVSATAAGIPPFPAGRRETDQHREWLSLYKAHSRLHPPARAVAAADGSCAVCGRPLASEDGVAHRAGRLHAACHAVVSLVEPLGPDGLDRLRSYLWPAQSKRSPRRQRKPGSGSSPSR
jgi:hypothetical protein